MAKITFHIGLHKTGTTTLQKSVFPKLEELIYLGRFQEKPVWQEFKEATKSHILVSDEIILGKLVDVLKDKRSERESWVETQLEALRKLNMKFPDSGIIVSFRKYDKWVLSIYKHYLKYGGRLAIEDFYTGDSQGIIAPDDLELMPRIKFIKDNFKKVFIFFLEDYIEKPHSIIQQLCNFLNVSVPKEITSKQYNKGLNNKGVQVVRFLNNIPYYGKVSLPDPKRPFLKALRASPISPYNLGNLIGNNIGSTSPLKLPSNLYNDLHNKLDDDYLRAREEVEKTLIKSLR